MSKDPLDVSVEDLDPVDYQKLEEVAKTLWRDLRQSDKDEISSKPDWIAGFMHGMLIARTTLDAADTLGLL